MLRMNPEWRFESPGSVPSTVVGRFRDLIDRIVAQRPGQSLLEHFKSYFSGAAGLPHHVSSSSNWASSDLDSAMESAAENALLDLPATIAKIRQTTFRLPPMTIIDAMLERDRLRKRRLSD